MGQKHPSLVPPADELLDDLSNDLHDTVYQKGLVIAGAIRSETSLQGRMRRPLLATLTEQQQQRGLSSNPVRASTDRPLGGGVLRGATTLTTTATAAVPTTATTATTATTTGATAATTGGARRGRKTRRCREAVVGGVRRDQQTAQEATVSGCKDDVRPDTGVPLRVAVLVQTPKLKSSVT